MARKKKELPEIININGSTYKLVVFHINTGKDGKAPGVGVIPSNCTMMLDKESVDLGGGECFMTAYIPMIMLRGTQ